MGDVIKLKHVRKVRAKIEQSIQAAENRVRHGRTRAEKERDKKEADRRKALLDSMRREDDA